MKCVICGGETEKRELSFTLEWKGSTATLHGLPGYYCQVCDEEMFDKETSKLLDLKILDHRRKVENLLTSDDIKKIVEDSGMTQKDLADFMGLSEKTFSRYINGTVMQSVHANKHLSMIKDLMYSVRNLAKKEGYTVKENSKYTEKLRFTIEVSEHASKAYSQNFQINHTAFPSNDESMAS